MPNSRELKGSDGASGRRASEKIAFSVFVRNATLPLAEDHLAWGDVMKLARREFLHLGAAAAAFPAVSHVALAFDYPMRPLHLVVGWAPGLAPDISARLVGQPLSERLGQPVVIDNKPGVGSNIGTEIVAHASPDGYTLLLITSTNAVNASIYRNLSFNFIRDIAPVAGLSHGAFVMVVNPAVPANTVPEFIAYAKANPGKINMGSPGVGTTPHVAGEMFKMMTGVDLVHVPYRSTFYTDLLSGQVQVVIATVASSIGYIRDGKIRALGVTTQTRVEALPDIPPIGEFVPGYEANGWQGIGVPRDTPPEIVDKLNKEINAVLADPKMKARLVDLGRSAVSDTPAEFGKFIADETDKWSKVVKFAGIKLT